MRRPTRPPATVPSPRRVVLESPLTSRVAKRAAFTRGTNRVVMGKRLLSSLSTKGPTWGVGWPFCKTVVRCLGGGEASNYPSSLLY